MPVGVATWAAHDAKIAAASATQVAQDDPDLGLYNIDSDFAASRNATFLGIVSVFRECIPPLTDVIASTTEKSRYVHDALFAEKRKAPASSVARCPSWPGTDGSCCGSAREGVRACRWGCAKTSAPYRKLGLKC